MITEPWNGYVPPFRIRGGVYFVGTKPASTHVIDTGDGLIMLDSGYQQSLYLVIQNMHEVGLDPKDLKYILHTHGHIDHFGATRALVEMTGAKTVIGEADRDHCNGKLDLSWAKELGMTFTETFEPDIVVNDGDKITLGNTEITCIATPGHTAGAMSFFFDVTEDDETSRCALCGGMGLNSMQRAFLEKYGLSLDCRQQFIEAMDRLAAMPVDIYLGNHVEQNRTVQKGELVRAGNQRAFIDPTLWAESMLGAKKRVMDLLEKEKNA